MHGHKRIERRRSDRRRAGHKRAWRATSCSECVRHPIRPLRVLATLGLLAAACSLDAPHKTWEPLNYAELEQAMAAPTGKLAEVDPAELLQDIPVYVAALTQTVVLFERIRELGKRPPADAGLADAGGDAGEQADAGPQPDADLPDASLADAGAPDAGPPDAGPPDGGVQDAGTPDAPADLGPAADPSPGATEEGTSAYFKLACPGPDPAEEDRDFTYGSFRIDSPALVKSDIKTFAARGHLLLTYDNCQTRVGTLTGESPAYFDTRYQWLGLQLKLSVKDDDDQDAARPVDLGTIVDSTGFRLLLTDATGGTFVLSVLVADGVKVSLAGADEEIGCEYTEDPPAIDCGTL